MNKGEIDEIEKRAASRVNLKVSPINSETTLKLIAHVHRLETVREAAKNVVAKYKQLDPDHSPSLGVMQLEGTLKACEEAEGETSE